MIGGDSGHGLKPDPGPLLAALREMSSDAGKAVMIGDTAKDVVAARAAGTRAIAVTFGYGLGPPRELGADGLINDFEELPGCLSDLP